MSTFDDDDIEFDFFDEPETAEASQRSRRRPRERQGGSGPPRGPRTPMRAPTGLVPLARLVGAIAIGILIVVFLVHWTGGCQGKSTHDEYASYASDVRQLATSSSKVGAEFAAKFVQTDLKESDLETSLQQYAQQEQQAFDQAQQIRPPGPLRAIHQRLIDALELRAKGLVGLGDALAQGSSSKQTADQVATALTAQGSLLAASDVVWDQLYRDPATQVLKTRGVTGVVIPDSHFVTNSELVTARSFGILVDRLASTGSSTTGTTTTPVTGKHGNQLISVVAMPKGTRLSTSTATTITVSADLAFVVTIQDSGDFPEYNVPVTLTITHAGGKDIVRTEKILVVQPGQNATATFTKFDLPNAVFNASPQIHVVVHKVPGEQVLTNNEATYSVFFTLSP